MSKEAKKPKLENDEEEAGGCDYDYTNGTILCEKYIPIELLLKIFRDTDHKTLLSCQQVCKYWRHLIRNSTWREKAELTLGQKLANDADTCWKEYYLFCDGQPFNRNLIKNHSGAEKMKHWTMEHYFDNNNSNSSSANWRVECPPSGALDLPDDPIFEGKNYCFAATSAYDRSKYQTIDLIKEGFTRSILDNLNPSIQVSEWYNHEQGHIVFCSRTIELIGENDKILQKEVFSQLINKRSTMWCNNVKTLKNYGRGLRKIRFTHSGLTETLPTDWRIGSHNQYHSIGGAKMAGACVKLIMPNFNEEAKKSSTDDSIVKWQRSVSL